MMPVLLLLLPAAAPLATAAATPAAQQTATPIKHVIIVTMENHSFDNIFGAYPLGGSSAAASLTSNLTVPVNLLTAGLLSNLSAVQTGHFSTANPGEGYTAYHLDWNHGMMDGFAANSGPQSMMYFGAAQLSPEWVLAEQFALGDMYFSSALTATMPNRLFGLAGYSPVINDYGLPPYVPFSQSIFGELEHYGIGWAYYTAYPSEGYDVLEYFHGISQQAPHVRSWDAFFADLGNNSLPAVSYISSIGDGVSGYSQHPSDNMAVGELWLYKIIEGVMHSPEWNSTALFINYDEGGGYYDHVPPPAIGGQQLGFRVPLILISPYAKENYVSGTVMNHASLLAFIDYNWEIPALNRFVALSNLPLDMFYGLTGGYVPRQSVTLPFITGFALPDTLYFPQSSVNATNLSSLFPVQPQIPLDQLPYQREGSSAFNLSVTGSSLYVKHNSAYTPFYESDQLLLAVAASMLVGAYLVLAPASRRR